MNDRGIELTQDNLLVILVTVTLWAGLILGSAYLVVLAANHPPPLALVLALSIVTLVCVAAFVVTRDQIVLQLASAGLGALAGAVATAWGGGRRDD